MVGVLLPSTVAGALANLRLTLQGAVPVNLNFTAGAEAMQSAIEQCGIRTVITSRAFLAKAKIDPLPGSVYIEDLLKSATPFAKLRAWLTARFVPAAWLSPGRRTPDSLVGVIFSSGSTGSPKGVMLSHYNLISQIESIAQLFWIDSSDRIVGVLPFFHSFGFTVTIWFPLLSGCGVVYHPNPTDARAVGELVQKYKATLLLTTPTFCATYTRKCSPPKNSPACATSSWAPRNFARVLPPPSTKNSASSCSKATAVPRCRRSWPSTFPTSAPAGTRKPATSPAPWAIRCPALPPALSIPSHSARCRRIRRVCCS